MIFAPNARLKLFAARLEGGELTPVQADRSEMTDDIPVLGVDVTQTFEELKLETEIPGQCVVEIDEFITHLMAHHQGMRARPPGARLFARNWVVLASAGRSVGATHLAAAKG
ncbi:hypothetical protein [Roseomonas genomospecies 6]|uniref:Uncharacterized protein n=1 Tax=Roseomonas genomospecies 6 TaxID=214106 RepID=A0A9W7KQT3_9PROT|nr:hypothetical protein [Roseomonas genomospecies 6]KAA0677618.1 hypothetical protein DS843_22525 [Roseomonas genomospecies 6]